MSLAGERIDLASTSDFHVGGLLVSPSACRVSANGDETRVEPKVMEVLLVLARAGGRTVTRDELIDACWDGRAVSDDAVSRVIAKVRQLGRASEPPHFTLETLPKVGFRLEVAASPPAAAQTVVSAPSANLFEIAPRWQIAGAAVALVSMAALLVWVALRPPALQLGAPPVSITAFRALQESAELIRISANAPQAMFRALTEARVPPVMTQDGSDPAASGHSLSIGGTVDRDGDTYRVTTIITDLASKRVIWSEAYERDATDLRGIEGEAAHDTAQTLQCALRERGGRAQTMTPDVFALLLGACRGDRDPEQARKAVDITRRLVELAPDLAAAHALRAMALEWRAGQIDHLHEDVRGLREEARAAADRALALDPKSVSAHLAMDTLLESTAEFGLREYHLRRALSIDPDNSQALGLFGKFLRDVGRVRASRELYERVENSAGPLMQGIILSASQGDVAETKRLQNTLAGIRSSWAKGSRTMITVFWEDPATVLATLDQKTDYFRLPKSSCLRPYLQALVDGAGPTKRGLHADCSEVAFDWRVRMLARMGEVDGAFAMLNQPMPNSRQNTRFLYYPEMKAVRHDSRFMPLAERLGLLAYWRQSGKWPDFCAEPDLPYDCKTWRPN